MALRRTLARQLLAAARARPQPHRRRAFPGVGRRLLHQSGGFSAERRGIPLGLGFLEQLLAGGGPGRARLDSLPPPQPPDLELEAAKERLRAIGDGSIAYESLVEVCGGRERIAKALEDGADIFVLGNVVFLRPQQIAEAIQSVIPKMSPADDPRWSELEELEQMRASIDARAIAGVRRELWGGLAYLVAQTAFFMRLTFWELSWDVMEPVCYFVTSFYFMAGYAFFLRTSKDPSFEGFFQSRFEARRLRLIKEERFDPLRLLELRRKLGLGTGVCGLPTRHSGLRQRCWSRCGCGCHRRTGLDWMVH